MKPARKRTVAAIAAASVADAPAVVDATTTRATLVSLGNRAGELNVGRLSALSIFVLLVSEFWSANSGWRIQVRGFRIKIFGTVSMAGRGRSSFTKRQKERSRQEKQREKAERKAQRKLEKPATGSEELTPEDFAAAAEQWALPGDSQ